MSFAMIKALNETSWCGVGVPRREAFGSSPVDETLLLRSVRQIDDDIDGSPDQYRRMCSAETEDVNTLSLR